MRGYSDIGKPVGSLGDIEGNIEEKPKSRTNGSVEDWKSKSMSATIHALVWY
jgi:hypothetical protein